MKSSKRGSHGRQPEPISLKRRPPLVFALEPRMMFDGAAVTSAAQAHVTTDVHANAGAAMHIAAAAHDVAHQAPMADSGPAPLSVSLLHRDSSALSQALTGRNVVFIDARVQDATQ